MTVTLETLRADFDRKTHVLIARGEFKANNMTFAYIPCEPDDLVEIDIDLSGVDPMGHNWILAANTLVVFRDYGQDAALLYKLSDGAIDPRKDGAA